VKPLHILPLLLAVSIPSTALGRDLTCKQHDPWAEFHKYNMRRSNPCEKVLSVKNVAGLTLKWSYPLGEFAESSPAVAMGMVFVGGTNTLYALNAKTGAEVWSYSTGNTVYSSPAVSNGIVYFGSADNNLYALNAHTGKLLWVYTAGDWVASSPTVSNGVVYAGSNDGNVYALNASTGAKLWSHNTNGQVGDSSPALAEGTIFVGGSYTVTALNAKAELCCGAMPWVTC
jgi:outer membrane protein assembly factor BamB